MAMTLRLTDEETEALRDYIERTSKRELLDDVIAQDIPRYAEALRRLGE